MDNWLLIRAAKLLKARGRNGNNHGGLRDRMVNGSSPKRVPGTGDILDLILRGS